MASIEPFPLERFGKFIVGRFVGRGAMGSVHLAFDMEQTRPCALKRIVYANRKELAERFKDEQRISEKLRHPCLSRVYETGQIEGELYLAMDWISGRSLEESYDKTKTRPDGFSLDVAVAVAKQVCRGLAYAQTAEGLRFVHRDISPSNIIVGFDGVVRLIDYGLAWSTLKQDHTQTNVFVGNALFAAPEQFLGKGADALSDVYSLGAVLWFLMTGKYPRDPRSSTMTTLPLLSSIRSIDADFDTVVGRATDFEPQNRFRSAQEFVEHLQACQAGHLSNEQVGEWMETVFPNEKSRSEAEMAAFVTAASELQGSLPVDHQKSAKRASRKLGFWATLGLAALAITGSVAYLLMPDPSNRLATHCNSHVQALPIAPKVAEALPQTVSEEPSTSTAKTNEGKRALFATIRKKLRQGQTEAALQLAQGNPALHNIVSAEVAYQEGNFNRAVDLATRGLKIERGQEAYVVRAKAYIKLGELKKAEDDYKAAIHLEPGSKEAKEGLAYIRGMR